MYRMNPVQQSVIVFNTRNDPLDNSDCTVSDEWSVWCQPVPTTGPVQTCAAGAAGAAGDHLLSAARLSLVSVSRQQPFVLARLCLNTGYHIGDSWPLAASN